MISRDLPETPDQMDDGDCFVISQKVKHTPPQSLTHSPLPPRAPSRPTHSRAKDSQDLEPSRKAEKPANTIQALQIVKDIATSLNPSGKNVAIKNDLLSAINNAINMTVKEEQEKKETAESDHPHEGCSYKHEDSNEMDELRKEISDLKGVFLELQETLKIITRPGSYAQAARSQDMNVSKIDLEMAKRERIEKNTKKREKMEVALTLRNASKNVQQQLESLKEKDITDVLQDIIHD